jgi:hypothetical protein
MKSILYLVFFLALNSIIIGCSESVKQGSWYQNIKTGEKIKIDDVGTGTEILARLNKQRGGVYWYVSGADVYRDEDCFGYVIESKDTPPIYNIEPIKRLEEDYLKIK